MQCTFKSKRHDGEVIFACKNAAELTVQPELVVKCNEYWSTALSDIEWVIDEHVCEMHGKNVHQFAAALSSGNFDVKIQASPTDTIMFVGTIDKRPVGGEDA